MTVENTSGGEMPIPDAVLLESLTPEIVRTKSLVRLGQMKDTAARLARHAGLVSNTALRGIFSLIRSAESKVLIENGTFESDELQKSK